MNYVNTLFVGSDDVYEKLDPNFLKNLIRLVYKEKEEYESDETRITTISPSLILPFPEQSAQDRNSDD